ncbi:MAG: hypothetical protein LBE20_03235 [Deltaproteobacteria bacterium]|nr:hypothetical protein [Deltaproteobacteria bacterium]
MQETIRWFLGDVLEEGNNFDQYLLQDYNCDHSCNACYNCDNCNDGGSGCDKWG